MPPSLWRQQEKSVCSRQCCRDFFLCVRVCESSLYPQIVGATNPANRQTAGIDFCSAVWKGKKGEERRRSERQNENLISPLLLKGWLGARRIYGCLASSPSSRRVSLQLLHSLLHSVAECTCLSARPWCHGSVYNRYNSQFLSCPQWVRVNYWGSLTGSL